MRSFWHASAQSASETYGRLTSALIVVIPSTLQMTLGVGLTLGVLDGNIERVMIDEVGLEEDDTGVSIAKELKTNEVVIAVELVTIGSPSDDENDRIDDVVSILESSIVVEDIHSDHGDVDDEAHAPKVSINEELSIIEDGTVAEDRMETDEVGIADETSDTHEVIGLVELSVVEDISIADDVSHCVEEISEVDDDWIAEADAIDDV